LQFGGSFLRTFLLDTTQVIIQIMRKIALSFIIISLSLSSLWGQGHKIQGKINGLKDGYCYLSYYYEIQRIVKDSAKVDAEGKFVFSGNEVLKGGFYSVLVGEKRDKSFDLVVGEQVFSFETQLNDLIGGMKFVGSKENEFFYSFQQKIKKDELKIKQLQTKTDAVSKTQLNALTLELAQYKKQFLKVYENMLAIKFLKAASEVEMPAPPKTADGKVDSEFANKFFVEHYLDNLDLGDDRLMRSPFVGQPIQYYFEQLYFLPTDSLKKLSDRVLARTKKNSELRKYIVNKLTSHFEGSRTMGHDAVFAHLVEKYYSGEPQMWDTTTVRLAKERVKYLRPLLMGSKIPDVKLTDTEGKIRTLHSVSANYTILYIYAYDCSHCQLFTPDLVKFVKENKDKGIEVFAPIFDKDETRWRKFIKTFETQPFINVFDKTGTVNYFLLYDAQFTPTIFILDKDKNIIGKGNLPIDAIGRIIDSH
jgi:peroxiredoxin